MPETDSNAAQRVPNRRRLNDRFVKTVKPEAKRTLYWDTVQPGFVLSVEPTGHKSYKLIYTFDNRSRWYTIANATKIGLKEARGIARNRTGDVYGGEDVQAKRQAVRTAHTELRSQRLMKGVARLGVRMIHDGKREGGLPWQRRFGFARILTVPGFAL
jgi:hypothetical protein